MGWVTYCSLTNDQEAGWIQTTHTYDLPVSEAHSTHSLDGCSSPWSLMRLRSQVWPELGAPLQAQWVVIGFQARSRGCWLDSVPQTLSDWRPPFLAGCWPETTLTVFHMGLPNTLICFIKGSGRAREPESKTDTTILYSKWHPITLVTVYWLETSS